MAKSISFFHTQSLYLTAEEGMLSEIYQNNVVACVIDEAQHIVSGCGKWVSG